MKLNSATLAVLAGAASANPIEVRQVGSGSYGPGGYSAVSDFPNHTVYMPKGNVGTTKLPVLVWGNGGCGGDGASNAVFLNNLVTYGYIAIASGAPGGRQGTTAAWMTQSIDWVVKNAGKGNYANVDATKIMAAGFSCGGVEAMAQAWDPRVASIGVISSGLLTNYTAASTFRKPTLYVLGGSGDIAYANGERDFKALPASTPSWKGNLPLGHGGDLFSGNGGKFGRAIINWMEYLFKNNTQAAKFVLSNGYSGDGWQVQTHALENLKPLA